MRKMVSMILVMLMMTVLVASNEASFEIKAYRPDHQKYLKVEIVDAIPESIATNPSTIDVTEHLLLFMGKENGENDKMSLFSEHVVFAYRVVGTASGSYTITLMFEPFYLDGNALTDEGKFIAAAYEIGNTSYTYTQTSSNSYTSDSNTYVIGETDQQKDSRIVLDKNTVSDSFVKRFSVTEGSTLEWIVRGSVAMDIGPTTYKAAEYGHYSSTVTVKLESNE